MERHKCKLCARSFANGRALGGHMKAHLATLPLPPKSTEIHHHQQLGTTTESASSSSYSFSGEEQDMMTMKSLEVEEEEKGLVYGLRENPKKSCRFADPEFSFSVDHAAAAAAASVVVQDRESETESSRNPTRRRSKRTRKSGFFNNHNHKHNFDVKKLNFKNPTSSSLLPVVDPDQCPPPSPPPPPVVVEPEPVSSVSDTSPDEDVAMCLMMLSRDVWLKNDIKEEQDQEEGSNNNTNDDDNNNNSNSNSNKDGERSMKETKNEEIITKVSKIRGKFRCEKCTKLFRSSQALASHKKICSVNVTELRSNERIFECPYCLKVFGSGQALGGHKRSHLMGGGGGSATAAAAAAAASAAAAAAEKSSKHENNLIDLNLPAPLDDDDFSVVSDA